MQWQLGIVCQSMGGAHYDGGAMEMQVVKDMCHRVLEGADCWVEVHV